MYNFTDLNTDNAHSNNTLFLFGGEGVQECVHTSLITTCSVHSRHVYSLSKYGNYVLSMAISFAVLPSLSPISGRGGRDEFLNMLDVL